MSRTVAFFRCSECGSHADAWVACCPSCEQSYVLTPVLAGVARPPPPRPRTLGDAPALPDVRVSTGVPGLDRVLGTSWRTGKSGVHVPSTVLFAGAAGAGKSTLLLRVAAAVRTKRFLYASTEQTVAEIRDNAERVGLTPDEIARIPAARIETLEELTGLLAEQDPRVVVLDSFNELVDPRHDTGDVQANLVRHATALKLESEAKDRAFLLITHMNKKEEVAGVQRVQHIVSAVLRLEKRGDTRVVHCPDKNRFGTTDARAYFRMTDRGLADAAAPAAASADADAARREKRRFRDRLGGGAAGDD